MKLTVKSLTDKGREDRDYLDAVEITLEDNSGRVSLSFFDGEPEDANLSRDFNDVYGIPEMIERAYEAGKRGEDIEASETQVDEL